MSDAENFDLDRWTPAFPGQRPPFATGNKWRVGEGNEIARKHGAYSMREVLPLAAQIAKELRATPELEYLKAPLMADRLRAYAEAEARAELVRVWAESMPFDEQVNSLDGRISPLELSRELSNRASNFAHRLGLSPAGAQEYADDIERAWKTIERQHERKQFQADLRDGLRHQQDGNPS